MTWAFIVVAMLAAIAHAVPVERDDSEEDHDDALMDQAKTNALIRQDGFLDDLFGNELQATVNNALKSVVEGAKKAVNNVIAGTMKKLLGGGNKAKLADTPAHGPSE